MNILFEDENYLILNKPAGLMVHSDGKIKEKTLVDWIIKNYPEMEKVGEPLKLQNGEEINRSGIVHRLDRETSGVIALAKNQKAFLHLKNQFKERLTKKIYKAFVYGVVKNDRGLIERAIGRSSKFGLWSAQRGIKGKTREAITEYEVIERSEKFSFLEIYPKTGRTHQIRVHLKAINYPVVCDKIYAPKLKCALGFERLALHAESLNFKGLNGEEIMATAPLPEDFKRALYTLDRIINK